MRRRKLSDRDRRTFEKAILMHRTIVFAILHILPLWILVVQSTWVSSSFQSDLPLLFYLVAATAGAACGMTSNAFRVRPVTTKPTADSTIGILPVCSVCRLYVFPRTFHCTICGCCLEDQIGHITLSGTCVSRRSSHLVFCGVWTSWLYDTYLLIETLAAFFRVEPLWPYVYGRTLLLLQLPLIAWVWIQLAIFSFQFVHIVFTNAIILKSNHVLGFETFLLQDRKRNPYNAGFWANFDDFTQPIRGFPWPALRPGEITDAYCEDILKYRGIDLRPTIREP
jgi:hypothetical protein